MTLLDAPLHQDLRIVAMRTPSKTSKHLAALGVTVDAIISLFEVQWGASVIYVKDSKLALDHVISTSIEVEPLEGESHD